MLYREIIAVCSEMHTKHINTLLGKNEELLKVKLAVYIITTGLKGLIRRHWLYQPYCVSLLMLLKSHSAGNQFCCWLNSVRRKLMSLTTQLLLLRIQHIYLHKSSTTKHFAWCCYYRADSES